MNMKAIVAQKLLPSIKEGVGRVPTVEVMTVQFHDSQVDPRRAR